MDKGDQISMKKIILSIFIALTFSCVSMDKVVNEFDSDKAYIAAYLLDNYIITLLDLNSNKTSKYRIKMNEEGLSVLEVPPGEYTIVKLTHVGSIWGNTIFSSKGTNTIMHVPLYMKTIIEIEKNSVTFLGNLDTKVERGFNVIYYTLIFDYIWEEAVDEINQEYYFAPDFSINPLVQLSLSNKEESEFNFNF